MVDGECEKIVAILHDVVEDSRVSLEELSCFGADIVVAVDALTQRVGESRSVYIQRISLNPVARAVKIADLRHNSDISRIPNPAQRDYERAERYRQELMRLES
jgi:(p)ppGpp synthase/HD superfamily hydrolase